MYLKQKLSNLDQRQHPMHSHPPIKSSLTPHLLTDHNCLPRARACRMENRQTSTKKGISKLPPSCFLFVFSRPAQSRSYKYHSSFIMKCSCAHLILRFSGSDNSQFITGYSDSTIIGHFIISYSVYQSPGARQKLLPNRDYLLSEGRIQEALV